MVYPRLPRTVLIYTYVPGNYAVASPPPFFFSLLKYLELDDKLYLHISFDFKKLSCYQGHIINNGLIFAILRWSASGFLEGKENLTLVSKTTHTF